MPKGWLNMRADHLAFKSKMTQGGSYPAMESGGSTALLAPTRPRPADADAPVISSTADAASMPAQPSIDSDLDAEFVEPPEDRMRRHEWIRYYVRENDLQKAFDLGWDGKPFRIASTCTLTGASEAPSGEPGAPPGAAAAASSSSEPAVPAAGAGDTEA